MTMALLPKKYYTLEEAKQYLSEMTSHKVTDSDILDLVENHKLNIYVDYKGIIHGCINVRSEEGFSSPKKEFICELDDYEIYTNAIFQACGLSIELNDKGLSLKLGDMSYPYRLVTCNNLEERRFIEQISGVGSRLYNMNDKENKEYYPNVHCKILFLREELLDIFNADSDKEKLLKIQRELFEAKKLIDTLNEKIYKLETNVNSTVSEGQGDTLLILGAVMECIKDIAKPNYTQQNLIQVIKDKYPHVDSLSESTLTKKFPIAKKHLKQRLK